MTRDPGFYNSAPLSPTERGHLGILKRLLDEDPADMTAAALASPNHAGSSEGWARKAQEINPRLNDDQAARVGQMMRREHFRKLGRLSAQARKLAREAQAELERADGTA
jgi:hypothetical protein